MHIVDTEGLDALSIRRLGDALNVNGASLYHHFKNKDEILAGVTQLALADVTAPRSSDVSWRVWLPLNTYRTRQALILHPELIPIMLSRAPMEIGGTEVEASVAQLQEEGIPLGLALPLMESLELLAVASALQHVNELGSRRDVEQLAEKYPLFARAEEARALTSDELFELTCASVIASVESAYHLKEAREASHSA